jgi:hypothetical protein
METNEKKSLCIGKTVNDDTHQICTEVGEKELKACICTEYFTVPLVIVIEDCHKPTRVLSFAINSEEGCCNFFFFFFCSIKWTHVCDVRTCACVRTRAFVDVRIFSSTVKVHIG